MPNATLRSCIIAELGYTFLSLDANQIELRVLAILSQDPQMLEDLKTEDLHMATAIRMFGWTDAEEEMKKRRYRAKQGNFALVYEATENKLAEMLDCSVEEALEFMADHRKAYPVLYEWMEITKNKVKEDGFTVNMFGRIRPLPDLHHESWRIRENTSREIINTLAQGTAVDIVKMMMLYLRRIFAPEIRLLLQVHDEILWEVPDEMMDTALELSKELAHAFPDYPVSTMTGKVYGEMKEIS